MTNRLSGNIKFALILKDGEEVRTIEELKANFDVYEILESFLSVTMDSNGKYSGKLVEWLRDRYYDDLADQMEQLYEDYRSRKIITIQDLVQRICAILDVEMSDRIQQEIQEYESDDNLDGYQDEELGENPPTLRKILALIDKATAINKKTNNYDARINFRSVARSQNELERLLKSEKIIYLLPMEDEQLYKIPSAMENVCYIGVEDVKGSIPKVMVIDDVASEPLEEEQVRKKTNIKFSQVEMYFKLSSEISQDTNEEEDVKEFQGRKYRKNKINKKTSKELFGTNKEREIRKGNNSVKAVQKRIISCMDANFPLLYLNTFEEEKADEIICSVLEGRKLFEWNAEGFFEKDKNGKRTEKWVEGWTLHDTLNRFIRDDLFHIDDECALEGEDNFNSDLKRSVLVLKDAHNWLTDQKIIAQLKYLSQAIHKGTLVDCNIVIISPILVIPKELEKYLTIITLDYLTVSEIKALIDRIYLNNGLEPSHIDSDFKNMLAKELKGLSEFDITNILSLALSVDKEVNAGDWALIRDHKKQIIKKMNLLEMIDVEMEKDDIGGLERLKEWLERKAVIFKNLDKAADYHVDIPKGVMIAGMPGCGKSITAKVTAAMFDKPLLRMDIGKIMGKYVGESEAKMHQALRLAENIAPCVLWIDEIEKAFSGINGDGGGAEVTTRLFGIFLTWMQEKKAAVFVVATANDATRLPPELLRKGRFDEIFYVGFPKPNERRKIFDIHFEKRGKKKEWNNLKNESGKKFLRKLIRETAGYSGADIEGVVRETIEKIFINEIEEAKKKDIKKEKDGEKFKRILFEVNAETTPLKKIMGGTLKGLLQTYKKGRFKNASGGKEKDEDWDDMDDEDRYGGLKGKWKNLTEHFKSKWNSSRKSQ